MSKLFSEEPTVQIRRSEANSNHKQVVEKSSYVDISKSEYVLDSLTLYGSPLLNMSAELLAILVTIPRQGSPINIEKFRQKLLDTLGRFRERGLRLDYHPSIIEKSCFIFCAAFDEAILNTVWGVKARWENYSLVSKVFSQRNGGEAFFYLLKNATLQPGKLTDFIELQYILLMLGFKGKYRYRDMSSLHEIKSKTYDLLIGYHSNEVSLAPQKPKLIKELQPWLLLGKRKIILFSILMVCLGYMFTEYQYRELSQPILRQLDSLSLVSQAYSANQPQSKVNLNSNMILVDEIPVMNHQNIPDKTLIHWEVILAVFSHTEDATNAIENLKQAGYHPLIRDIGTGMQVYIPAIKNVAEIRKLENELNIRFGFNATIRKAL